MDLVLGVSAAYMALVGLGYLVAPDAITFGVLGSNASAALIWEVRVVASTFLGIAVLNWLSRGSAPSKARDAVMLGNTVGFGLATVLSAAAIVVGSVPATGIVPTVIALVFTVWFLMAGKAAMSKAA